MRLKSIRVCNFRSFSDCSFNLRDFTSLIGPNNSGKSSLLRAIAVFLNQVKPELEEWRQGHEDEDIVIEGCFEEIQDWERDIPGISGIIYNNEIRLRLVASRVVNSGGDASVKTDYEAFKRQETITGWSAKWSELDTQIQEIAQEMESGFNGTAWRTKANQERVRQIIREQHSELVVYGDEEWSSDSISINAALKQAMPQAVLVEAVKDASNDAKPASKTTFGLLLNRVVLPALQHSSEYQDLLIAVKALDARIRGAGVDKLESIRVLEQDLHKRMSSIIESRAVVTLDPPDTDKFIGNSTAIRIDDGTETPIHLQGHGVQRALIFALIEVLAKQEAIVDDSQDTSPQRATILLFEEPELYIHPHLMRRLKNALQEVSESPDWQVIISTHSPFLVDVATDPLSLIILRRANNSCPQITQLETDPFAEDTPSQRDKDALRAALDFHPTVTEAFFASQVVLVEGDTEVAVLRHTEKLLPLAGINEEKADSTTIVSCGGKWTIPGMAKLLSKFGIPYRVIHDQDRMGKSDEDLQNLPSIHPYRANTRIREIAGESNVFVVDDTFEHVLDDDTAVPSSAKPYRAWKKVRELCEQANNLDHVPRLREVVEFAFNW